jgi:hypothetical protein
MTVREKLFLGIGLILGLALGYQAPEVVERIFKMGLGAAGYLTLLVLALSIALLVPFLQDSLEAAYRHVIHLLGKRSIENGRRHREERRPPVNPWGMPNPPDTPDRGSHQRH